MKNPWEWFTKYIWLPLVYAEILFFIISPFKPPLWVRCSLVLLGAYLGSMVTAMERRRP